jgi:hypothetical protein
MERGLGLRWQSRACETAQFKTRLPFSLCRRLTDSYSPCVGTLYYGDNLDILRRYLKDDSVDLVYLDPPFNSAQNYNAFFHAKDGTDAASQLQLHWTYRAMAALAGFAVGAPSLRCQISPIFGRGSV